MTASDAILRVFVYGTLKRGECRESCWPHPPQQIQNAFVHGTLYDLGDYPALLPGSDRVVGEIWSFPLRHAERTLEVLDEIEDYRGRPDDLYQRQQVTAWLLDHEQPLDVFTYFYCQPQEIDQQQRVLPSASHLCTWRPH